MRAGAGSRRVLGDGPFHHALLESSQQTFGLGQREANLLRTGHSGRPGQGGQRPALYLPGVCPDLQPENPLHRCRFGHAA